MDIGDPVLGGSIFGDPIFQAAILPLAAAFVLSGLLRAIGREGRGRVLAGGAIAIAFLIAYVVLLGLPDWRPAGPIDKVVYIALGALFVGAFADLTGMPVQIKYGLILVIPLFGLAWVAEPQIRGNPDLAGVATLVLLFAANGVATSRFTLREGSDLTPSIYLGAGAAGLGLIGLFAGSRPAPRSSSARDLSLSRLPERWFCTAAPAASPWPPWSWYSFPISSWKRSGWAAGGSTRRCVP